MADISVTAANVISGGDAVVKTVTAGVALTAGQAVYQDTSDKKYKLADADTQEKSKVAGIVLNGLTTYMGTQARSELIPELERQGIRVLGELPEDRRLLGVTVGELAQHLEGRFLVWEEGADNLVEHLMIGGLILDSGTAYFEQRENKAVVVRGDRPDIQMAALATPTSCLLLTGGKEPIEYVLYEAEQVEVPIARNRPGNKKTAVPEKAPEVKSRDEAEASEGGS